ncbi:AAA family ATPase [uncultured Rikenella sp.]|uniref:AAA family ATPase n=1 Tax=uncultured Rikenella sp. TaxID=368003 RepID=UPI00262CAA8E|nr:AAA family ATPase [uncultured Rikenella sp.]
MQEFIRIRNFGPLKEVEIDPIQPFTLFIGPSASGKSTLLKVVALFRYLFKMKNIRSYLKHAQITKSPFRFRIDSNLRNCGLEQMVTSDTLVEYGFKFEGREYAIKYAGKQLKLGEDLPINFLSFYKVSFISENRTILTKLSNNVRGRDLGFYFNETYGDFDEATDVVQQLNLDYLDFKFDVRKGNNGKKKYFITPADQTYKSVELKNASSGLQSSTPLMVIAHYFAKNFSFQDAFLRSVLSYLFESGQLTKFQPQIELKDMEKYIHMHIEEPELSLYPPAQRGLIESLVKECFREPGKDRQLSLMIATHSPYILNYLNVLLRAYQKKDEGHVYLNPDKVAVFHVSEGRIICLNSTTASGESVIDAYVLTEEMAEIARLYKELE